MVEQLWGKKLWTLVRVYLRTQSPRLAAPTLVAMAVIALFSLVGYIKAVHEFEALLVTCLHQLLKGVCLGSTLVRWQSSVLWYRAVGCSDVHWGITQGYFSLVWYLVWSFAEEPVCLPLEAKFHETLHDSPQFHLIVGRESLQEINGLALAGTQSSYF
jgi:hypothetical protein